MQIHEGILISTLTSLRDVTITRYRKRASNLYFYSHISARCDKVLLIISVWLNDFYSHISARCDNDPEIFEPGMTDFYSHISARCDAQWNAISAGTFDFYSHISARCDTIEFMDLCYVIISTLTSLRDVTAFLTSKTLFP